MDFSIFEILGSALSAIWTITKYGGWVLFVILAVYILFKLYEDEIQTQYVKSLEWTFLEIKPPKENQNPFYSMEQVFIQLHMLFDNFSFQEKYLEGKVVFWMSMEIISLGGAISYILKIPTKQIDLIEASLYANFPDLQITEVEDYLANFEFDPDSQDYEFFATEFVPVKAQSIPLRTYREFEGLKSPDGDKIIDPLATLFEAFARINQDEIYALQFVIKPAPEGSLNDDGEAQVTKLQGEKDYMQVDDITKLRIQAIKNKIGKPGFFTKIRLMHIGAKPSFNKNAKKLIISPFKIFSSPSYNAFKPAFSPKLDYKISPSLEQPYIDYFVRKRKIDLFDFFKARSIGKGMPNYILSTDELATLYHFPITAVGQTVNAAVATNDMKRIEPPANLPI